MEYREVKIPEKHNGGIHFGHEIVLYMAPNRFNEINEFIASVVGIKHSAWRFHWLDPVYEYMYSDKNWSGKTPRQCVVRFTHKDSALLFKLAWSPCDTAELFNFNDVRTADRMISITGVKPRTVLYRVGVLSFAQDLSRVFSALPGDQVFSEVETKEKTP